MGAAGIADELATPDWGLVADIGGTHARFACFDSARRALSEACSLRCADFAGPGEAALAYLERLGRSGPRDRPRRAAFAIAAPVDLDPVRMTNHPWSIGRAALAAQLGLDALVLLNDFEALALGLPRLAGADLRALGGPALARSDAPMAVLGPGTGLGVALCLARGPLVLAVPTEGGHATAAPMDEFESAILALVRARFGHVSWERLLSGIGLPVLYEAVARLLGEPPEERSAERITRDAEAGHEACRRTLEVFCAMLGTCAGNVALGCGARGGVFVAGGIAQALADRLAASRFRARFEDKGRYRDYLSRIPTSLIVAGDCALRGAAQALPALR